MSFALYDKAVGDKISKWVVDPKLRIIYPDETKRLFQYTADEQNDILTLPLISISRDRNIEIKLKNRRYAERTGLTFNHTDDRADHLNHIPIILRYQIDIYTRYREEAEEYVRNFIFNIINYPTLVIQIPYHESGLEQSSFMELEDQIQDNSDIPERLVPGQFTRMTINFTLKDAQLFSYTGEVIPKVTTIEVAASDNSLGAAVDAGVFKQQSHYIGDQCELEPISILNEEND